MRLNLVKCSFGLSGGRFSGFLLTQRSVEANLNQIKTIESITAPKFLKGLHALAGSIASLRWVYYKPDMSGRLASWTIKLSQFHIKFQPRTAMKLQALADFITEPQSRVEIISTPEDRAWTLFTDGSSISQVEGAWVIFTSPEGFVFKQVVKCTFPTTNNEA